MAGIGLENFQNILKRSRNLVTLEGIELVDDYANGKKQRGSSATSQNRAVQQPMYEQNRAVQQPMYEQNSRPIVNSTNKNGMPKEILRSMAENPINENDIMAAIPFNSVEDDLLNEATGHYATPPTQRAQPQIQQPINYNNSNGVDYSVIKALIDESFSRNMKELKQKLINEEVNKSPQVGVMMIGEKLQIVDKNGNIYEAQLKKVGNINKK